MYISIFSEFLDFTLNPQKQKCDFFSYRTGRWRQYLISKLIYKTPEGFRPHTNNRITASITETSADKALKWACENIWKLYLHAKS